jgi:Leucine-rich repeat (LRR) protein
MRDPRIEKILRNRDKRKDLSIILNCQEDEIAINENEINDNTRIIYLPGRLIRLTKLPPNLEYAFCSLDIENTPIKSLGKLKRVGSSLYLSNSQIEDLGDLEEVGWDLRLKNTSIKSLGKLKRVCGGLDLSYSQIEDLGDLEEVGLSIYISKKQRELEKILIERGWKYKIRYVE